MGSWSASITHTQTHTHTEAHTNTETRVRSISTFVSSTRFRPAPIDGAGVPIREGGRGRRAAFGGKVRIRGLTTAFVSKVAPSGVLWAPVDQRHLATGRGKIGGIGSD